MPRQAEENLGKRYERMVPAWDEMNGQKSTLKCALCTEHDAQPNPLCAKEVKLSD